jgi:hypothetical protein
MAEKERIKIHSPLEIFNQVAICLHDAVHPKPPCLITLRVNSGGETPGAGNQMNKQACEIQNLRRFHVIIFFCRTSKCQIEHLKIRVQLLDMH